MEKLNLEDFKLIVFDLDGVILDISEAIRQSIQDSIDKYGIEVETDKIMGEIAILIEKLQCIPIPKIILNAKELLEVSFLEDQTVIKTLRIAAFIYSKFKEYKEKSGIYLGVDKIIRFLSAKNVKLAMLSNNKRTSVEQSLEKHDLKQYFLEILGANDTEKLKPEPDGLLKILKDQSISNPSEVLFIGDMKTDVQAGKAAKIKTLCVASGLNNKEELLEEKPDFLVNNTQELAEIFGISL
ncbi:MAG: HAD-IA family hydrolase [Candidatus Lokiarchaeota archaeon]|nr:HAD-IA family hydrolase [Candidatus Lokiarchaeota archaeon]